MAETVLEGMLSMETGDKVVVVPGVEDVGASLQRFKWPDYVTFVLMVLMCIMIGVYFGFCKASKSAQDYLVGGRKMKLIPITMSLIASFISGISILGIPTETYLYGIQYLYLINGLVIMALFMNFFYLPVFYNLKLTSTYEYLEKRFDKRVRVLGSLLFTINMMTWLPIVIYVPALAFNQVSGINVHFITPLLCVICIFYTTLGGLKAVVWTDVIQACIMFASMLLVAVKGAIDIGGMDIVWQRNLESGRIEGPNLDLNLSSRYTIWSLVIGGSVYYLQTSAVNQNMIQRYLALPSLTTAKKAVWLFVLGLVLINAVCCFTGLLIYATYHNCDPLTTKLAKEKDQLLPLLVMEVLGDYPGLSGIFVAGVLSASLSSLSTGLNSMAAVVLEDFYHFFFTKPLTERMSSIIMKSTVVVFGTICVCLVYIIEQLGAILQVTMSIGTIASGPSLGLFTMGIFLPWVNSRGALLGGATSLGLMSWLCFKAQHDISSGHLEFPEKPLSTQECHYHFVPTKTMTVNVLFNVSDVSHPEEQFIFHHISYLWYTLMGTLVAVFVGLVVSLVYKPLRWGEVSPELLSPCLQRFYKNQEGETHEVGSNIVYTSYGSSRGEDSVVLQNIAQPE